MQKITYFDKIYYRSYLEKNKIFLSDVREDYEISKKKINQPHDKTIKSVLDKKEEAVNLINKALKLSEKGIKLKLESKEEVNMRWMDRIANAFDEKYEEGIKNGFTQGVMETAKKLIQRNMEVKEIQEITGLSEEEIEKLAKSNA